MTKQQIRRTAELICGRVKSKRKHTDVFIDEDLNWTVSTVHFTDRFYGTENIGTYNPETITVNMIERDITVYLDWVGKNESKR